MRIDSIPVWVKFPDLHFSLWNPVSLGKITLFGTPIKTDKLTAVKGNLEYARMLIGIKIPESLPHYVGIEGPYGLFKQRVEFEWKPIMCALCKKIGHEAEQCKNKEVVPLQAPVTVESNVPAAVVEKISETGVLDSKQENVDVLSVVATPVLTTQGNSSPTSCGISGIKSNKKKQKQKQ